MLLSRTRCMKCERGFLRLQADMHSTYFTCITCGARMVTRCPHCGTPSIALDMDHETPVIRCRGCECSNAQLAEEECAGEHLRIAV